MGTLKLSRTPPFLTTTQSGPKTRLDSVIQDTDVRGGMSFLKWAGGKGQLISELESRLPQNFNNYFEPFVGGASLFFHIKNTNPKINAKISDVNEELINSFLVIRNSLEELILKLEEHKEKYEKSPKKYYYNLRDHVDPNKLTRIEKAARFIFLNKTCWNGLYRVNSKGEFNVPHGKNNKPNIFDENKLRKVRSLLKNAKIISGDFSYIIKDAKKGDFIYFDPPYIPISRTSKFTDYTKSGFTEQDQIRLAKVFKTLDNNGCLLMLSNSDSKIIRKLYKDYKIDIVKARRVINSQKNKRGKINELLITNY